ncbi:restriction endonuclease subunit S [Curvibacter sp. HBC28]|uniref:Restriction endonuclease subunit S n=1 Tax=Curvibacter microcysteis TaxID=3026419 RepID=A0ABT5MH77_9BURK|nr:restriction endonuclease subunit S [Curvibacter sp. HBC28]MDD0815951.1 restriction endonuclease subunit S [Curvibacter sp. HBC28]
MSQANYLEKLLDGVGVEWMPLTDVVDFKRGEQLKPTNIIPGPYPIVTASKTEVGSHSTWNFGPVSITITSHGAYAGHVNYWSTPIWLANNVFLLSPKIKLLHKFLYYFLKNNESAIQGLAKGGGVPYFNTRDVAPLLIPIPCPKNPKKSLKIQTEIVRLLDSFTELTAQLHAELTARREQYHYYRDELLSFDDSDVEWKTLEEVTKSIASGRNKDRVADGPVPVYGSTGLIGFTSEAAYSGEVLLVARVGANAGRVNAVSGSFDVSDNTLIVRPKDEWNIRFAFHQLTHMNLNQYAVGGGQPLVTGGLLKGLKIPFPSMREQERIAGILDKFHTLTTSLTAGLPHEIELRQKQYEYYRDLLMSFPKPEEVKA